jgi:hypothetical protein
MKKIIKLTESDLTRIVRRVINEKSKDNELDIFIKRRSSLIDELIEKNIDEVEEDGTLFNDEFEFADNIINWVVQDMKVPDDIDENDIINHIKDEHGEYIMSRFNSEDDEEDEREWDDDDWDDDDEKTHNAFVQKIDDKIEFLLNGDYDNEPEYMEELYDAIVKLANTPTRKRAISYIKNKLN